MENAKTAETQKIVNEQAQPVHITLTKNSKGYQWEISYYSVSVDNALGVVAQIDSELKAKYGAVEV